MSRVLREAEDVVSTVRRPERPIIPEDAQGPLFAAMCTILVEVVACRAVLVLLNRNLTVREAMVFSGGIGVGGLLLFRRLCSCYDDLVSSIRAFQANNSDNGGGY